MPPFLSLPNVILCIKKRGVFLTTLEAIKLFQRKVHNEIIHSSADEDLQDSLIRAVNNVAALVIAAYEEEASSK